MFPILRMRSLMSPTFSLPRPPVFLVVPSKRFSFVSNPIDSTAIPLRSNVPSAKSLVFHSHNKVLRSQPSCHFSSSPSGAIHVIVGPMFAGKTSTLLQRIHLETELGRKVAIIKSSKDTRYGLDSIVSHDGVKLPCWALSNLSSFRQKFGSVAYEQLDVIGIDEAQFFEDLYDFCREAADQHGKTVIVAGLDGDYLRRSFGSVLDIIPLADSVTKLTARCELCGKRALFTLRKTEEKQTELIGGADVYMPVCRWHYVSGQVAMEAARVALESQAVQSGSQV